MDADDAHGRVRQGVYAALRSVLGYEPEDSADLAELMDSLDGLEVLIELGDTFQIEIDELDLPEARWWATPGAIVDYVSGRFWRTGGGAATDGMKSGGA